ncbi:MAG TPA: hypothetical protein VG452_11430, partial [Egibacteraceae bacterium]|nr:hypothetical protein [Egibacteraceae bacterium]
AAPGTDSLLRSEARWLAPVLGLLALAGALVGIPFAAGFLDVDVPVFGGGHAQESPAPEAGVALPVVQAAGLDPQGDGSENDHALGALTDADPQTTWRTDLYHSAAFGGLKDGVGFWVDLGASHRLRSVVLTATTPGVAYEVHVADRPAPTVAGWRRLAAVPAAAATEQLRFEPPVTGRYLLVWVTANLQPDGRRYKAEFSELVVHGSPA